MCMYLTRQLPLVAKRDIICVKYLRVTADKEYKTPCQCTTVPIGEIFKAHPARVEIRNGSSITKAIHGGAIHALTYNHDKWFDGCLPCKAIIPAGTEYWVDVNGYSLAAKQMIITNQTINIETPDESLLRNMLEQVPTVEGISVGDRDSRIEVVNETTVIFKNVDKIEIKSTTSSLITYVYDLNHSKLMKVARGSFNVNLSKGDYLVQSNKPITKTVYEVIIE